MQIKMISVTAMISIALGFDSGEYLHLPKRNLTTIKESSPASTLIVNRITRESTLSSCLPVGASPAEHSWQLACEAWHLAPHSGHIVICEELMSGRTSWAWS